MAVELTINDKDLQVLAGQVVIVTGSSSGMGLAATKMLLDIGGHVVAADLKPSDIQHQNHTFVETDVADWASLRDLFKRAKDLHGRIDHVFANAGIGSKADYFAAQYDDAGELLEPSTQTYEVNLRAVINTCYLGLHYMQNQQPAAGSIVVTASSSALQRFRPVDYAVAKHGALGLVRALACNLVNRNMSSIRINCITPGWTATGMVRGDVLAAIGAPSQPASVPATSALYLMAKSHCQGYVVYSDNGKHWEIDEHVLLPAAAQFLQQYPQDATLGKYLDFMRNQQRPNM